MDEKKERLFLADDPSAGVGDFLELQTCLPFSLSLLSPFFGAMNPLCPCRFRSSLSRRRNLSPDLLFVGEMGPQGLAFDEDPRTASKQGDER